MTTTHTKSQKAISRTQNHHIELVIHKGYNIKHVPDRTITTRQPLLDNPYEKRLATKQQPAITNRNRHRVSLIAQQS